jgi:hypothetical protein
MGWRWRSWERVEHPACVPHIKLRQAFIGNDSVLQGWSVFFVCALLFVATVVWIARCAVHTQAMLAAHHEKDWLIDAFVWIDRRLTGQPPRLR